jgi:hypothetical protein
MNIHAPDAHPAQDPAANKPPPNVHQRIELRRQLRREMLRRPAPETPERAARRARRIRILRAVALMARTKKTYVAPACRAVGLHDQQAMQEVRDLCDERGIPRRHQWGTPLPIPRTQDHFEAHVPSLKRFWRLVLQPSASVVIAGRKKRIVISKCIVCGESFAASQRTARYCGGTCRIRHWRRATMMGRAHV